MLPARPPAFLFGMFLLGLLASGFAAATEFVSGSFLATNDCPAWVSKAEQTNPDNFRLVPGRIYSVTQVNIADAPDAYRLDIAEANPKDRWIMADCGEYPPKSNPKDVAARFAAAKLAAQSAAAGLACPNPPPSKDPCRACGKATYNLLSLVWLPARCEQLKGKPERPAECEGLDAEAYAARNLILGEMRPALGKCKKSAGFCGAVEKEIKPYTDYPEIKLSEENLKALAEVMPATSLNTGVERHQWFKHGTCTGLPENGYFHVLIDLAREFNQSGLGSLLAEARGNKIVREDFYKKVDELFGKNARKRVNLVCSRDGKALTEVQLFLPAKILPGYALKELIPEGPGGGGGGNCASKFLVPALGSNVGVAADPEPDPAPESGKSHRKHRRSGDKSSSGEKSGGDRKSSSGEKSPGGKKTSGSKESSKGGKSGRKEPKE